MRIDAIVPVKGRLMAVCSGKEIKPGFKCSKISANGTVFNVISCFAKETVIHGIMAAYLEFDVNEKPPVGKVEIIS